MTQEDKKLLLKDLCARLPYGVKIMFRHNGFRWDWEQTLEDIRLCDNGEYAINGWGIHGIKPYLRPMSSMTEEEDIYYNTVFTTLKCWEKTDWLNSHYFDYRELIEKGLAIEVTKENNPYKEQYHDYRRLC